MSETDIVKTLYLKAPIEKVWAFLTVPEKLARWFHETDRALDERGAQFTWLRHDSAAEDRRLMWGEVIECDPPRLLVHTFSHEWIEGLVTTVRWELAEVDGGTRLLMTHGGLGAAKDPLARLCEHDRGWEAHLTRLREIL